MCYSMEERIHRNGPALCQLQGKGKMNILNGRKEKETAHFLALFQDSDTSKKIIHFFVGIANVSWTMTTPQTEHCYNSSRE